MLAGAHAAHTEAHAVQHSADGAQDPEAHAVQHSAHAEADAVQHSADGAQDPEAHAVQHSAHGAQDPEAHAMQHSVQGGTSQGTALHVMQQMSRAIHRKDYDSARNLFDLPLAQQVSLMCDASLHAQ